MLIMHLRHSKHNVLARRRCGEENMTILMRDSVLSSMLRIKKHEKFLDGRGIHGIWERDALKWNWISPD